MSRRAIPLAGISAATTDATTAQTNTPTTRGQETSKGPVAKSAWPACHQVSPARVSRTPATTAMAAEATPRTTACPSTYRRSWRVSAPLEAASASERRWRAALTAKAGPASSVVSRNRPIAARSRMTSSWRWSAPSCCATLGSSSDAGGGSRKTWRLWTRSPWSFSARTSGQVTGSARSTRNVTRV